MKLKIILALGCVLCNVIAADPFSVMDTTGTGLQNGRNHFEHAVAFPYYKETALDRKCGFTATVVDLNHNWKKPFVWHDSEMNRQIRLVSASDDYISASFSLFVLRGLEDMHISASPLKGPAVIESNQIRFFQLAPPAENPAFNRSMLLTPELKSLKAGEQINMIVLFNIPRDTPPGRYSGTINLNSGNNTLAMPVTLRVMPFRIPDAGNFGFYINGNLYDPHGKFYASPEGLVKENLNRYFNFYKIRRLNSLTLYDNFPDLRYVNGEVTGNFTDFSLIAMAMKQSGLQGKLIIDLRDIGYWSNAVARKLEQLGGKAPTGDIGITMAQRKSSKVPYSESARKLYAQALHHLLTTAEKEKWPEIGVLPEEELGDHRHPYKNACYSSFMPVIMKECPELSFFVDNTLGYDSTLPDFGARDHVKHRQYNSWTEEALQKAEKDKAEIWSYNYGPTRLAFGFLQQRLRSKGHHQWADQWISPKMQWQFLRLSDKGVVSSLEVEQIHEGIVDYAACEHLKRLIMEQEKSGNVSLAEFGRKVLKDVSADLPIVNGTAQIYASMLTNEDLNARRWQVFQAIEKLSGCRPVSAVSPGNPVITVRKVPQPPQKKTNYAVDVKISHGKLEKSGEQMEKFWSKPVTPLKYLAAHEAMLRARASSLEEFQKQSQPSSASYAYLACLPEGLAIFTTANHVRPAKPYRYKRIDNDVNMWQDDCFEFFFDLPNGNQFHLMFNSAGAKTFLKNKQMIPAAGIRSYTKSPINSSGGTSNKILIPWHYFGLNQPPIPGTTWKFNVGREFHSHNAIFSWARVAHSFQERDKWGRLTFVKDNNSKTETLSSITVIPPLNKQVISSNPIHFTMETRSSHQSRLHVEGELVHSSGQKISLPSQILSTGISEITLKTDGLQLGQWTLQLWLKETMPTTTNSVTFTVLPSPWL